VIGLKRRLAAIRRDVRDEEGRCALWVDLRYAEPFDRRRFGVVIQMIGGRGLTIGRGHSARSAVRDAERQISKVYGRVEDLQRV
jgi:hypothetical protein